MRTDFSFIAQLTDEGLVGADRWSGGASYGLIIVTLVLFVALGFVAWILNNRGTTVRRGISHNLDILETRPLGGRQFLMVVAYGEERFLLSVCPGRVEYLCPLPIVHGEDEDAPDKSLKPGAFTQILEKMSARQRSKEKP